MHQNVRNHDLSCYIKGGPKSKPAYCCNNFVYCEPTFIIFGTCIGNLQLEDIVIPPNTVCVTALSCKISMTLSNVRSLLLIRFMLVHDRPTTQITVHIIQMSFTIILCCITVHSYHELLETSVYTPVA